MTQLFPVCGNNCVSQLRLRVIVDLQGFREGLASLAPLCGRSESEEIC